jgi:glycosyltransferase involved in cell wall biosynthesis
MSIIRRVWEALPRKLRRELLFGGMSALAPRISKPEPAGAGSLTVAGYFAATTGLGEGARRMLEAMHAQGLSPIAADLTSAHRQGPPGQPFTIPPGPGTIILHVNGPMLPWALWEIGRDATRDKRVIAYWAWELPRLPPDWERGLRACHRIWAPSHFCADAFGRPDGPPVTVVPHPVPAPMPSALHRSDFGLPQDAFIGLVIFDAASSLSRKNPLGAIAAHQLAFGTDPSKLLVLKTHNVDRAGNAWLEVAAAAAEAGNVRILAEDLPKADLAALMLMSDVFISLHRAEGFGLSIAEAMALGKPVIATGWSGNMDFLRGPGVFAIPCHPTPAFDPQSTYDFPEMLWAEPDITAAATELRHLATDTGLLNPVPIEFPAPDYAKLLG